MSLQPCKLPLALAVWECAVPLFRIYTPHVRITNTQLLPPCSNHGAVTFTLFQLIKQEMKIQGTFKGRTLLGSVCDHQTVS